MRRGQQRHVFRVVGDFLGRRGQRRGEYDICKLMGSREDDGVEFVVVEMFVEDVVGGLERECAFGFVLGDSCDSGVQPDIVGGGFGHFRKDLPIPSLDRDGAFDRHADQSLQTVNTAQVGGVVDPCSCLDDFSREELSHAHLLEKRSA